MKVKLVPGTQQELLLRYKRNHQLTWSELAAYLDIDSETLRTTWCTERVLLSREAFEFLGGESEYLNRVIGFLPDTWGRRKGGLCSRGSTKEIALPARSPELAELVGIVLGDGHVQAFIDGPKRRSYQIQIAGHVKEDRAYLERYVAPLCERLFCVKPKFLYYPKKNEMFVVLHGKKIVEFFIRNGIASGNKLKTGSTIPAWVFDDPHMKLACLRGLIDTDGSIHHMSRKDAHLLRISFTSYSAAILSDTRRLFVSLGFHPSKIICGTKVYLSRQSDIARYLKEVGFANEKHRLRFARLSRRQRSPMV